MGGITELATSAPGYSSIRPDSAAPLAETLRHERLSTGNSASAMSSGLAASPMGHPKRLGKWGGAVGPDGTVAGRGSGQLRDATIPTRDGSGRSQSLPASASIRQSCGNGCTSIRLRRGAPLAGV